MLYLIRHCQTTGQEPDAPLTPPGVEDARTLAEHLAGRGIVRVVSSPYRRAVQSAEPLASRLGLAVEVDARLVERVLSPTPLPDWREHLQAAWDDFDLALPGGESSRAATERGMMAIGEVLAEGRLPAAIMTHGNLLALILHALDGRPGFETWSRLSNPDVFQASRRPDETGGAERWHVSRAWSP